MDESLPVSPLLSIFVEFIPVVAPGHMSLAEFLEGRFRGDIRFRGAAYIEAERVSITRITPDSIYGSVRDGTEYQTQIARAEDDLRMYCTCDRYQKSGVCKHLWGTILAVDKADVMTGPLRVGAPIPPFAVEPEPVLTAPLDLDDVEAELVPAAIKSGKVTKRRAAAPEEQEPLKPWMARLEEIRGDMNGQHVGNQRRERAIFYEIDCEASHESGQLVLQTSQRQRRADGQWGKLKPLKLRVSQLDEIEDDSDARILAYLSGATAERNNWYAQQAETQSTAYRYTVPHELSELILPMLCGTDRLRYLGAAEKNYQPLQWDEGDAWELTVEMLAGEDGDTWYLEGSLRRGEEVMSVNDARLIVAGGLVLTEDLVARLQDFNAFEWTKLLRGNDEFEVPNGDEEELVDRLLDMPVLPKLILPDRLRLEEVTCEPEPMLVIQSPRGPRWQRERLHGGIEFDYMGSRVSGSSARWAIVQRERSRCVLRNQEAEDARWSELLDMGFRRLSDKHRSHDVEITARDLGPAVRSLISEGWRVRADGKQVRQPGEIRLKLQSGIDWFELDADVDFEGSRVRFPELLSALARGDSTVRLDDGSLGILPEEWLKQFGLLAGLGAVDDEERLRFGNDQVALLDAMLSGIDNVDYDDRFIELRDKFRKFEGVTPSEEPDGFKGSLRGYQREGLGWLKFLQEFNFGGCLADDMGLGKTVQLIALLQHRRRIRKKVMPSLVVVPKSLLFNWAQECERFAPELNVMEYTGVERASLRGDFGKQDIIITTYGTLRRDIMSLRDTRFDYIVLDEAQTIKNAASQVAKASRLLQGNFRIALSGTPIENHLGDLWSIFEFLNPGMLGRSSVFRMYAADNEDDSARTMLAQGLRPFILRRTKEQVASELPEKVEETIYCDLGTEQRRLYEELRDHYRQSLLGMVAEQGLSKSKMHVLEALLRLRQAACHPALLDRGSDEESSAKLDYLVPHLEELISEGHKALVFSQFTSMLSILRGHLDKRGIVYEYLDGKTRDRQARVERFQESEDCPVFLISLKAGGLGLNLTAADYVFLLDPWWNPAVETQAIDRAHRVGQKRHVFAYRIICRDTVEEKIAALQSRKQKLADAILEANKGSILSGMSTEDLEMLLS